MSYLIDLYAALFCCFEMLFLCVWCWLHCFTWTRNIRMEAKVCFKEKLEKKTNASDACVKMRKKDEASIYHARIWKSLKGLRNQTFLGISSYAKRSLMGPSTLKQKRHIILSFGSSGLLRPLKAWEWPLVEFANWVKPAGNTSLSQSANAKEQDGLEWGKFEFGSSALVKIFSVTETDGRSHNESCVTHTGRTLTQKHSAHENIAGFSKTSSGGSLQRFCHTHTFSHFRSSEVQTARGIYWFLARCSLKKWSRPFLPLLDFNTLANGYSNLKLSLICLCSPVLNYVNVV